MRRPAWIKPDGTLTNPDPTVKAIHKVFIEWARAVAQNQSKKSDNALRVDAKDIDDLFVQVVKTLKKT